MRQLEDFYEEAERRLFPKAAKLGEPGWRCWTPKERQKIYLMAHTLRSENFKPEQKSE